MRKLSLLSTMLVVGLMIGLVGSVAFIGNAADDSHNVTLNRNGDGLTLEVTSDDLDIQDFDPTDGSSLNGESAQLEVHSTLNGNTTWTLSVDSVSVSDMPAGADADSITSAFGYDLDDTDLHERLTAAGNEVEGKNGKFSGITYNYSWDNMSDGDAAANMPEGTYELQVTYTVTSE